MTASPIASLHRLLSQRGLPSRSAPLPPSHPPLPTGFPRLDQLLTGGLPRGHITELTAPVSAGGASFLFSVLAHATELGETAAYIDGADSLDPQSAAGAGIVLDRLLWVRGGPVQKTWQAANLVVDAGGFGVIVIDLGGVQGRRIREWRERSWVRIQRAIEHTPTTVILLAGEHLAATAAALVLEMQPARALWQGESGPSLLLEGLSSEIRIAHQRRTASWGGAPNRLTRCPIEITR